ncbi:fumarylacetoacetate hydrolase family protein [Pararhodobacter oceanensis]|uniref:Fumarylacetoacetase-like C-terminal domain-containing protein n=1 Tax=Pararhodobacter oceanensis TaxID=2172121 RepID=A0A2T8HTD3_9RHOB|nr:fumarylacetoacetate hydrolase family protein [Pararhodobacter oceanensis]PVH28686.1 hypothetical protein DDE20_10885 [Pararhodobacter oceanensis]
MTDVPPVTFALRMGSMIGCPPFPVLDFDDGASVALHAVRPLAETLGLRIPEGTIFDLVQDWERGFPALAELVQALAYSPMAVGHRGDFVPSELITDESLLPAARQVFLRRGACVETPPISTVAKASGPLTLGDQMKPARPSFCLAAVIGKQATGVPQEAAPSVIAGWAIGVELRAADSAGRPVPGALIIGPNLVPAAFASDLSGIPYTMGMMGREVAHGALSDLSAQMPGFLAEVSAMTTLLPGDLLVIPATPSPDTPAAGTVDTLEALASGFGYLKKSFK